MKIALAGNPNSGKTTIYNALTGRNEKIGNWTGVTVDKKESVVKDEYSKGRDIIVVDLPGAYSMSPFTSEEAITSSYIKEAKPSVIINIVDGTNLSRSLFFTTQLLELGIPVVMALNKGDMNRRKGIIINTEMLSKRLNCPVVETVSKSADGLMELISAVLKIEGGRQIPPYIQKNNLKNKLDVEVADRMRFEFVNRIVSEVEKHKIQQGHKSFGDKVDVIITNKWLGIPIFALVMYFVFQISQVWVGKPIGNLLVEYLEKFQSIVDELLIDASPFLSALLVDGVIGGVSAVVGFLPLVMIMYFLIALLEDCGYMSRVTVVLDPIFKRVGLSGRSVIPFVIAIGCAVPGVMASRTIKDEKERRATALLAPFMPCGAKISIIALFAGKFFGGAGWVSTVMYFLGIVIIFFGAVLINIIAGYKIKKSFFIIELPDYKYPSLLGAFRTMCSRGWAYIVKASTIILLCNTVVQIMQSFNLTLGVANSAEESILAFVAKPFAYLLLPVVGVVSWQLAAATITGFIAKENVVATLSICFAGLNNFVNTDDLVLMKGAGMQPATMLLITKIAALAYLMFNLYSPPCIAAVSAMNVEMKSIKWLLGGICFQIGVGYTVAYLVYTIGTILTAPASLNIGAAIAGLIAVVVMALIIVMLINNTNKKIKEEYALKASTGSKNTKVGV